jgi:hypothetical protein
MRQNLQNCSNQTKVERVVLNALAFDAALPPDIRASGDCSCHRSEPDWHFPEKPIHLRYTFASIANSVQRG